MTADVVPPGAGLGRRRRPRRRAGRDRGRPVHRPSTAGRCTPGATSSRSPGKPSPPRPHDPRPGQRHSHAFHRALRGRTQRERGTFWTWREQMYAVAERLDAGHLLRAGPGDLPRDGRGRHHERWASSTTCTTSPTARRTTTPTRWAHALGRGRRRGRHPDHAARHLLRQQRLRRARREGVQRALQRRDARSGGPSGSAIEHGPRRRDPLGAGGAARPARTSSRGRAPLHVHLSEQVAENDACLAAYGVTPTRLLHDEGLLGPRHHGRARHPPDRRRHRAARQHRHQRLHQPRPPSATSPTASGRRGGWPRRAAGSPSAATATRSSTRSRRCAASRWTSGWPPRSAATGPPPSCSRPAPPTSLGFDDAGAIAVGERADLVTLDTTTPRTAGTGADENTAVFAATAADVTHVVVDGERVYTSDDHEDDRPRARRAIGSTVTTHPDHPHRRAGHQRPRAQTTCSA